MRPFFKTSRRRVQQKRKKGQVVVYGNSPTKTLIWFLNSINKCR